MSFHKVIEELRQKYIRNLPEGRTAKPVKNMTDSDFPDMCYFPIVLMVLTMMNLKKGFTSTFSEHRLFSMSAFMRAILLKDPLYKNTPF